MLCFALAVSSHPPQDEDVQSDPRRGRKGRAVSAIRRMRARLKKSAISAEDLLLKMEADDFKERAAL
jgi:hypothetical protein